MKMSLKICGTLEQIKNILRELSIQCLHSNECGIIHGGEYDYAFVDSEDLYSDDSTRIVVNPEERS
jgi:hypothetical protein